MALSSRIGRGSAPSSPSLPTAPNNDPQDDFSAFQLRPVIRDFRLAAELFASNGDTVLICGRVSQERQGMHLVSYEIPSNTAAPSAAIRLAKVVRISKKTITQLETVPVLKIALLLGDGIITIYEIDSLCEITNVSTANIVLFSTWYDPTSGAVPSELKIGVATRKRSLVFHRYLPQQRRVEEIKGTTGTLDLIDIPRAMGLSQKRICIAYRRSYMIVRLDDGMMVNELSFNMTQEPVITCLQDRTQWCVQLEGTTVFLNSDFEPLYDNGIIWKDVPSAIVQSTPYVLALMNQSIEICTFNGSQFVPVQQIAIRNPPTTGKTRLWMDSRTQRIYAATTSDVFILESIPVHTQLQNYIGTYKYDLALILIRAVLGISVLNDPPRTSDGHSRGETDLSTIRKEFIFTESTEQDKTPAPSIDDGSRRDSNLNEPTLWVEYYRIGTMYAFQLFHRQQFEQAFAEFNEFLTDPTEIISLFSSLSANVWLPNCFNEFRTFVNQHRHFAEPNDFVGVKLENALRELQRHLTDLRSVFQSILRRTPDVFLEVQSLVKNQFILRPVRDLLIIVETALLKAYLIDNKTIFVNALLRSENNMCLPSEVEKELKKHHRRTELVSFYEKHNRHGEALQLIVNTENLATPDNILNYLMKLNNENLKLIFEYVRPMLESALKENNREMLDKILRLFVGESTPTSPLSMDSSAIATMKLESVEVYEFFKKIDEDFAILYLENICFKPELGLKQRDIHNRLVYAYCDQIKKLAKKLRPMLKHQDSLYQDNDMLANQSPSSSVDSNAFSTVTPVKRQLTDYENKLKLFLLNQHCHCDFDKLEAFFLLEKKNSSNERLFSIHYAIVLGKLGQHEKALKTFFENGFFTDAEHYCDTIYSDGNTNLAQNLYRQLIQYYLDKGRDANSKEMSLKAILRIVNNLPERLDPVQTLEILPAELKLNSIKDFIEHSLQTCLTNKRSSQLERHLLFLKLTRAQSKRINSENHAFVINADTQCARFDCTQPFNAKQAVVRFPNDKIVHFHCRKKYEDERDKMLKKTY